jgi:hypothetical protein
MEQEGSCFELSGYVVIKTLFTQRQWLSSRLSKRCFFLHDLKSITFSWGFS